MPRRDKLISGALQGDKLRPFARYPSSSRTYRVHSSAAADDDNRPQVTREKVGQGRVENIDRVGKARPCVTSRGGYGSTSIHHTRAGACNRRRRRGCKQNYLQAVIATGAIASVLLLALRGRGAERALLRRSGPRLQPLVGHPAARGPHARHGRRAPALPCHPGINVLDGHASWVAARVRRPKHTDVRDDAAFLPGSTGWGDGEAVPNCEARLPESAEGRRVHTLT